MFFVFIIILCVLLLILAPLSFILGTLGAFILNSALFAVVKTERNRLRLFPFISLSLTSFAVYLITSDPELAKDPDSMLILPTILVASIVGAGLALDSIKFVGKRARQQTT